MIWSPYFERDYIRGIATDKIPAYRFENERFRPASSPGCWARPPRRT